MTTLRLKVGCGDYHRNLFDGSATINGTAASFNSVPADEAKGSGLTGLVEALGGTMTIASHAGSGTSLLVRIPLDI